MHGRFPLRRMLLLGLLLASSIWADDPTHKQVLILHSYHPSFSWTANLQEGIVQTLRAADPRIDIRTEFLDWKHFPTQENLARIRETLQARYRNHPFEVVFTTDNAATDFVVKNREELFPGAAIVFCGVNGYQPGLYGATKRILGVAEVVDSPGTLDFALRFHPKARRVLAICDRTETGRLIRRELEAALPRFGDRVQVRFTGECSTEEVLAQAKDLDPDTIILLCLFTNDTKGRFLDLWELPSLFQAQGVRAPVYSLYEEAIGYGTMGGSLMDGRRQGAAAASLGLRILQGEDPSRIQVQSNPTVARVFDFKELSRFGIPEATIPPGSRVVNAPETFYSRHRPLILGSLILSVLLVVAQAGLLLYRRQMERQLRHSEARLRHLVQNMPVLICAFDSRGRIIVWNRACELSTGYLAEEAFDESSGGLVRLLTEADRTRFAALARGEGQGTEMELRLRAKSGEMRILRLYSESRRFPIQGWAGWVVGLDVTRQLLAEEMLQRSQRMESLGAMAGGLAHDFGNLLSAIKGSVELLELEPEGPGELQHHLDVIRQVTARGVELVKQLTGFSRAKPASFGDVDLHGLLNELRKMLDRTLPRSIEIHLDLQAEDSRIRGDDGQLMQVLLNLSLNARDAMGGKGRLTLQTRREEGWILLSVQDSGSGMSPEIQRKIFEPFFTTKDVGKGTGMGLAMVYTLVANHGGTIQVESEVGKGTTFHLRFPVQPSAEPSPKSAPE